MGGAGRCFVRSGAGTVFIRSAVTEVVASAIRLTPVTGTTRNKAPEATGSAGLLEPPEQPQESPASSSVWREDPGLLSRMMPLHQGPVEQVQEGWCGQSPEGPL